MTFFKPTDENQLHRWWLTADGDKVFFEYGYNEAARFRCRVWPRELFEIAFPDTPLEDWPEYTLLSHWAQPHPMSDAEGFSRLLITARNDEHAERLVRRTDVSAELNWVLYGFEPTRLIARKHEIDVLDEECARA